MTWIVVRDGTYRYLRSKDTLDPYTKHQGEALRFDKRWKAKRAAENWEVCWSSSWRVRVVKLVPHVDQWVKMQSIIDANTQRIEKIADTLEQLVKNFVERMRR